MRAIDRAQAELEADTRHARLSAPWELYHEASKMWPTDPAESPASDPVREASVRAQEQVLHRISTRAARASACFHHAPNVFLPFPDDQAWDEEAHERRVALRLTRARRSALQFSDDPIPLDHLSFLLSCSAGVTHIHPAGGMPLRAAPASGALYEIEVYLAVRSVEGLEPGVYHYRPATHALEAIATADRAALTREAAVAPELLEKAPLYVLYTSVIGRLTWKYDQRAYRFTHLNAGYAAGQLGLAAVACGYATCPHGGFLDDAVARALDIDGISEFVVHSVALGRAAKAASSPARTPRVPVLRRYDTVPGVNDNSDWTVLEALVTRWATARQRGDGVGAREMWVELRAHLPGDRGLLDLAEAARDAGSSLRVADEWILRAPVTWKSERLDAWAQCLDGCTRGLRRWLGVSSLPRTLIDLVDESAIPLTENRGRALHRRVRIPRDMCVNPPADMLLHELTHANFLPHNAFLAEGVASAALLEPVGGCQVVAELRRDHSCPPIAEWIDDGGWPQGDRYLTTACAGAFVSFLCDLRSREALFAWLCSALYPATEAERAKLASAFESHFGLPLVRAVRDWWAS